MPIAQLTAICIASHCVFRAISDYKSILLHVSVILSSVFIAVFAPLGHCLHSCQYPTDNVNNCVWSMKAVWIQMDLMGCYVSPECVACKCGDLHDNVRMWWDPNKHSLPWYHRKVVKDKRLGRTSSGWAVWNE